MNEKHCNRCGKTKTLDQFYKKTQNSYRTPCKECNKELSYEWRENNQERRKEIKRKYYYSKGRTKQSETTIRSRLKNMEYYLYSAAKHRAIKYGIPFDITIDDIIIPEVCPIFNEPFVYKTDYAASLDRINPKFGYTQGNVQVISRKANTMKSNASKEEMELFAKWVLNNAL